MGGVKDDLDVNDLLRKLHLSEAEQDDVVIAQEVREKLPEVKWMAAARLLTTKKFSVTSLETTMRSAWNPAKEVTFRSIEKNCFVIQAFCLGDWKKIMEEGPWLFRGHALMLEEFDGSTTVPSVIPNRVIAWIQIHKLPHLYRTEAILNLLAAKVGEVKEVEMRAVNTRSGDFHRARVFLPADRALVRVVSLAPEGKERIFLQIKYEKLPRFCGHCGFMGHNVLECGTGEHAAEDLQFGDWMVASGDTWRPGTPRLRSYVSDGGRGEQGYNPARSGRGGRTSTRGRGRVPVWREKENPMSSNSGSRKRTSSDVDVGNKEDQETDDTATSPIKPATAEPEGGANNKALVMAGGGIPPPPPPYQSPRERKKAKRGQLFEGMMQTESAGSLVERRQEQ